MDTKHILDALLSKSPPKEQPKRGPRRQFNVVVHEQIINSVKHLAAHLAVKQSTVVEHAIQLGTSSMEKVVDDPERRELLRKHLVDDHQLSDMLIETDDALQLGDTKYAADIMHLAKVVVRHYENLQRLLATVRQEGKGFEQAHNCSTRLLDAAVRLAERLVKHPLGEEQPPRTEVERLAALIPWPGQRRSPQRSPRQTK